MDLRSELKLYNSLGRRVEPFRPLRDSVVHMYTCGPTVYGDIQAPVIQVNEGAQFEGRVQRPGKAAANGLTRFMGR